MHSIFEIKVNVFCAIIDTRGSEFDTNVELIVDFKLHFRIVFQLVKWSVEKPHFRLFYRFLVIGAFLDGLENINILHVIQPENSHIHDTYGQILLDLAILPNLIHILFENEI